MDNQKAGGISAYPSLPLVDKMPAAKIGVILGKQAITGFKQVIAKAAAIIGQVMMNLQVITLIGQQAVHLVLKIVMLDPAVADPPQENTSPISPFHRVPDIQEDSAW